MKKIKLLSDKLFYSDLKSKLRDKSFKEGFKREKNHIKTNKNGVIVAEFKAVNFMRKRRKTLSKKIGKMTKKEILNHYGKTNGDKALELHESKTGYGGQKHP